MKRMGFAFLRHHRRMTYAGGVGVAAELSLSCETEQLRQHVKMSVIHNDSALAIAFARLT